MLPSFDKGYGFAFPVAKTKEGIMGTPFGNFVLAGFAGVARTFCGVILALSVGIQDVTAATYYISPAGADANAGTALTAPWKTFQFAISRLLPGDTLILMDGTYSSSNSGLINSTGLNGTSAQPITFKALNERRAHIHSDGSTWAVLFQNSSYLTFEGLQVSSQDNGSATNNGSAMGLYDSHHITLKRMLMHHNNRYANSHLLVMARVNDSLVEESEFYYHHRHGIMLKPGSRNIMRRIYCNSRGYGNIPGGYPNGHSTGGDMCISLYPGDNNIIENTIADATTGTLFDIQAVGTSDYNRFLGNIALKTQYGIVIKARPEQGATALAMPKNNTVKDLVVINAEVVGAYFRGVRGQRCDNCMLINNLNNSGMIVDVEAVAPGDGVYSFFSDNSLSLGNGGSGFLIMNQIQTWRVDSPNSYGNKLNYNPSSSTSWVASKAVDALLGACRVWIPDVSPMKRTGKNGADIGANILYRYQNGVLTNIPLWDPTTGEFPHGALVTGLNDVPGQSLFDVHKRLNVNTNGCSFPAGYASGGGDSSAPARPANLRVF